MSTRQRTSGVVGSSPLSYLDYRFELLLPYILKWSCMHNDLSNDRLSVRVFGDGQKASENCFIGCHLS